MNEATATNSLNVIDLKSIIEQAGILVSRMSAIRWNIDNLGKIDGTEAMRLLSLFAQLKDTLKLIDNHVTAEMGLPSSTREAGRLQARVLEYMTAETIPRLCIEGRTLHLHHQLWASATDVDKLAAHDATSELVKPACNGSRLSALVREWEKDMQYYDPDALLTSGVPFPFVPEELRDAIKVSEVHSVRTPKS